MIAKMMMMEQVWLAIFYHLIKKLGIDLTIQEQINNWNNEKKIKDSIN